MRALQLIAPFTLTHIIPAREIEAEERRIGAILLAGGLDPQGLRLDQPAIDLKLRALADEALAINVTVASRGWSQTRDGDVEVVMGFPTEGEAVAMRLAVG